MDVRKFIEALNSRSTSLITNSRTTEGEVRLFKYIMKRLRGSMEREEKREFAGELKNIKENIEAFDADNDYISRLKNELANLQVYKDIVEATGEIR